MTDGRNLRAYYYSFNSTGNDRIDAILEAVAVAGKRSHHTEDWGVRDDSGFSYIDIIQNAATEAAETFQSRVKPWMDECFGPVISADKVERNHRFLEEALELVQACGATREECYQLVDYVYGRPDGDVNQEVGGVMVTLAALCLANGFDMHAAGETELVRIWGKIEQIRAKQAGKPKNSPLPQEVAPSESGLATFAARIARMTQDGEEIDGGEFVIENDDAVSALNELIEEARGLVGAATTGQPDELLLTEYVAKSIWDSRHIDKWELLMTSARYGSRAERYRKIAKAAIEAITKLESVRLSERSVRNAISAAALKATTRHAVSRAVTEQIIADYEAALPERGSHVDSHELESGVVDGWQPIETAPKYKLLMLWADTSTPDIENWKMGMGSISDDGVWHWDGSRIDKPYQIKPTHWMPVPQAPKQGGDNA